MDELLKLAEWIEAAEGPDRELDHEIALARGWTNGQLGQVGRVWYDPDGNLEGKPPKFTASLDAALTLVPERHNAELRMPVGCRPEAYIWRPGSVSPLAAKCATPALALGAAALRALANKENPHG